MSDLLLLIAILPVILLGLYIYKKDRNKEPNSLLVKLFVSGILSCFLVLAISEITAIFFPFVKNIESSMNFIEFSFYIFIFIALTEEFCKWLMTYGIGYQNKEFDEIYDIVVYAVFVALGFAAFENILYVFGIGSVAIGVFRGLLAIPGHVCDGIAMGYYLSLAKYHEKAGNQKEAKKNKIKSIWIPTLYHGIYDYCCLTGTSLILILFLVFIIFLYTTSIKKVKILAQENISITNKNKYCPNCGKRVEGNFCTYCGYRQI